jgi:hypothetical protein
MNPAAWAAFGDGEDAARFCAKIFPDSSVGAYQRQIVFFAGVMALSS